MLRILTKTHCRKALPALVLLCMGGALVLFPTQSADAAREGLQLCANVILPSLFPFFVLSTLVVELGLAHCLGQALEGLMWPLFHVSGAGASALVLGFVGGYPVGARTAIRLYETGLLSKDEVHRLLSFCNNSGPAFILGVVGAGVFGSGTIGLLLYFLHAAASLCVGLLFRGFGTPSSSHTKQHTAPLHTVRFSTAFTESVKTAFSSLLNICAFVTFFAVVLRLLDLCGIMDGLLRLLTALPLSITPSAARHLLTGIVELSSGVSALTGCGSVTEQLPLAAFMLGWAGLCVHCQVLSFLTDSGLSAVPYLLGKALHGLLSALFAAVLAHILPLTQPVSGYLATQAETITMTEAHCVFAVTAAAVWLLWLLFLAAPFFAMKKRGGKSAPHGV